MEVGGQSAVVVPSCGESGTPQVAGQDSPLGGEGGAARALVHQSGAHERRRSHLGWAR